MAETIIFGGYGNSKVQVDGIAHKVQHATYAECVHGETAVDASRRPGGILNEVKGGGALTIAGYSKGNLEGYKALATIGFQASEINLEKIYGVAPTAEVLPRILAARAMNIGRRLITDSAHDPKERQSNRLHGRYLLGEVTWRALHHANSIREVSRFDTLERYIEVTDKLQVPIVMGVMIDDGLFRYEDRTLYRAQAAGIDIVELTGRHPHFVKYPVETLQQLGYSALRLAA